MNIKSRNRGKTAEWIRNRNRVAGPEKQSPANTSAVTQPAAVVKRPTASQRWLYFSVVLAVVAGLATWYLFENVVWARVPPELAGKWVVVGGQQDGATFDFYSNGVLVGKVNAGGSVAVINAGVRVDGKKILSTTQNPDTGTYDTTVLVIKTLTANELVVEDERGNVMKMKRAE